MSSAQIREPASFGKRSEPHKIIVVHKGRVRQFNINPVVFSALAGTLFMFLFGYFSATAYLIFRDDLISSTYAQHARMQHEYEDRIASLRSKLDRVTSRQLLDQQAIETQVQELMARQQVIGSRDGSMQQLLDQARKRGLNTTPTSGKLPVPAINPAKDQKAEIDTTLRTGSIAPITGSTSALAFAAPKPDPTSAITTFRGSLTGHSAFTRELFGEVAEAISIIDTKQREEVDAIRIAAAERATTIGKALKSIGMKVKSVPQIDVGGPFVPLDHSVAFETHLQALHKTLKSYDHVSEIAKTMPLGSPLPGAKVSSNFGSRVDPFNGRIAMHSGMDFKAKRGTPVKASGDGKVIKAGRNGGYGRVVEIEHANGYVTRYAHLSRISVKVGQRVTRGQTVGKVGSTGRSTGPHLHYEVRKSDKARNPSKFIRAGYKIRGLL